MFVYLSFNSLNASMYIAYNVGEVYVMQNVISTKQFELLRK